MLADRGTLGRWIVPVQIIQILYLVLVVYFVVKTGQLLIYLVASPDQKTIGFNLVIFIQSWFIEREMVKALDNPDATQLFSFFWIYGLSFSVYIVFFCLFFTRGPIAILLKDDEKKIAYFYCYLLLPAIAILTGVILHMAVLFQAEKSVVVALASTCISSSALTGLLFVKSKGLYKTEPEPQRDGSTTTINQQSQAIHREDLAIPSGTGEQRISKKTIISIPYYLVLTDAEGCLFKPADRFDLLKLSIKLLASKNNTNHKKQNKDKPPLFGKLNEPAKKFSKANTEEIKEMVDSRPPSAEHSEAKDLPAITGLKNKFFQMFSKKLPLPNPEHSNQTSSNVKAGVECQGPKIDILSNSDIMVDSRKPGGLQEASKEERGAGGAKSHDGELCITCCNSKCDAVFLPCLHGGLCFQCAQTAFAQRPCCPLCNSHSLAAGALENTLARSIFKISRVSLLPIPSNK